MLRCVNTASVRRTEYRGTGQTSARPIAQAPGMIQDLVDGRIDKSHELKFDDGPELLCSEPYGKTAKQSL